MSEIMFYCGSVFTVFLFIVNVIYFFKVNIIEAFRYYFRLQGKNKGNSKRNSSKSLYQKTDKSIQNKSSIIEDETDIIGMAENYATMMLDAEESTQILDDGTQMLESEESTQIINQ